MGVSNLIDSSQFDRKALMKLDIDVSKLLEQPCLGVSFLLAR